MFDKTAGLRCRTSAVSCRRAQNDEQLFDWWEPADFSGSGFASLRALSLSLSLSHQFWNWNQDSVSDVHDMISG